MEVKACLIILLLALVVVAESTPYIHEASRWGLTKYGTCDGAIGECIGEENEMLMDSHPSRMLRRRRRQRFISYGALRANSVPCGRRGHSYYNCNRRHRANPYRRGCNIITHCARITG
ncbi:protein RALF-like 19 [Quercus suber]|nr:protein RALF-like 19 [Quercus suber]POF20339.1 protein ralf-like 19 [Quercus suber]